MLTQYEAWKNLETHHKDWKNKHLRDLFAKDSGRFERYHQTLLGGDILFDYSKHLIEDETLASLFSLARAVDIEAKKEALFRGDKLNFTEGRSVLHTALRYQGQTPFSLDGQDVRKDVREVLQRMVHFTRAVQGGDWKGATGEVITDVVNIGIGGSDLGPAMVTEALTPYHHPRIKAHFVSNVDGTDISEVLRLVRPETTLFLVASKTFTTQETMMNAHTARDWLVGALGKEAVASHFAALSVNIAQVEAFGIDPQNAFPFWDWVGGRYSLWSAIGLSIMLAIGPENFNALLGGAYEVDEHFLSAPLEENVPVIMALLGVWYGNFFGAQTLAVLPYDQFLRRLPDYLQQADMESNGKGVDKEGHFIQSYATGPIVFGQPGTNGQHSFYQLLHQGRHLVPCDFIGFAQCHHGYDAHHRVLLSNFLAQTEALMVGKTEAQVEAELQKEGKSALEIQKLVPHMTFTGNRPSSSFLIRKLTPKTLGALIALYEHKIFVQGMIWDVNSYDQWGVQLGKQLASRILPALEGKPSAGHDSSTEGLLGVCLSMMRK